MTENKPLTRDELNKYQKDARRCALKQVELLHEQSKKIKSPAKLAKLSEAMAHLYGELRNF